MRRFFIILFVLSLGATAAAFYWRTFMPEAMTVSRERPAATRSATPSDGSRPPAYAPGAGVRRVASDRQDWAVTISILSSVISALAALVQTWLTARAMPPVRRVRD
jgi:hypothetical protein